MNKGYPVAYRRGESLRPETEKRLGFQMPFPVEVAVPASGAGTTLTRQSAMELFRRTSQSELVRTFGRRAIVPAVEKAAEFGLRQPLPWLKIVSGVALVGLYFYTREEVDPVEYDNPQSWDISGLTRFPFSGAAYPDSDWGYYNDGVDHEYTSAGDAGAYSVAYDAPPLEAGAFRNGLTGPTPTYISGIGQALEELEPSRAIQLGRPMVRTATSGAPNPTPFYHRFDRYQREPDQPAPLYVGPTITTPQILPVETIEWVKTPWREWHKVTSPAHQVGYGVPETDPSEQTEEYTRAFPIGGLRPLEHVMVWTSPSPFPGPNPKPLPDSPTKHDNSPPTKGREKERKVIANIKSKSMLGWVLNGVTEGLDFLDAIHDALPPWKKKGWYKLHRKPKPGEAVDQGTTFYMQTFWVKRFESTPQQKMKEVWENWETIDVEKALWNVVKNQIEDKAFGKLGNAQQKAARPMLEKLGRPVGLGTGPAL